MLSMVLKPGQKGQVRGQKGHHDIQGGISAELWF